MKKVILGLVAIAALAACSKDNGNDNSNGNGEFNNNGDPTIEQETFPKEITYKDKNGNITMKSVYTIVGGKIASWSWTSYEDEQEKSENTIITYKGNLPEKEVSPRETTTYTYEGNKLVKKIEERQREGGIVRRTETTYTYEGNNISKIIKKKASKVYWNNNLVEATSFEESNFQYSGNLIVVNKTGHDELADKTKLNQKVSTITYTIENGNLAKEEVTISPSHKVVTEYTYDSKKNPKLINLQKILFPDYFTNKNFTKNNILTITETTTKNGKTEVGSIINDYIEDEKMQNFVTKLLSIGLSESVGENHKRMLEESIFTVKLYYLDRERIKAAKSSDMARLQEITLSQQELKKKGIHLE